MPFFLWTVASLFAYIIGLLIVVRVTPQLVSRRYDEGLFVGIAALALMGGMLAFGAVVVPLIVFSGATAARVLAFLFLFGILIVGSRISYRSFRPRILLNTILVSRVLTGTYSLLLALAAIYCIVLLFR